MTVIDKIKEYEGDKREKEYINLKEELKAIQDKLNSFDGTMQWVDVKWLFEQYNLIKNSKLKPCRCSGKIRGILNYLKKYYE